MAKKKGLTPDETERLEREVRELQQQVRALIQLLQGKIRERDEGAGGSAASPSPS